MPNPTGVNEFAPEVGYGEVKRLQELMRSAPMSGAPESAPAINTPNRAQDQAVRGGRGAAGATAPQAAAPMPQADSTPTRERLVAETWMALAADPKASTLVKQYAEQAAQEAGL